MIQVITQLESGWWEGVLNGVRGWFPSNYIERTDVVKDNFEVYSDLSDTDDERSDTDGEVSPFLER